MGDFNFHGYEFEFNMDDWPQSLEDVRENMADLVYRYLSKLPEGTLSEMCDEWGRMLDEDEPVWANNRLNGAGAELQDALNEIWREAFKNVDTSMLDGCNFDLERIEYRG